VEIICKQSSFLNTGFSIKKSGSKCMFFMKHSMSTTIHYPNTWQWQGF
jgi:hypothetical protein